jgi:hypothetical protein
VPLHDAWWYLQEGLRITQLQLACLLRQQHEERQQKEEAQEQGEVSDEDSGPTQVGACISLPVASCSFDILMTCADPSLQTVLLCRMCAPESVPSAKI